MRRLTLFLLLFFTLQNGHSKCPQGINKEFVENKIQSLYPHQPKEVIDKRLKKTSDSFYFLRSFVPYYYQLLNECTFDDPQFKKLLQYRGLVVGDPHPMNFGGIHLNKSGLKIIVSFNDPDDGGPGFYVADIIRYLSSAQIFFNEVNGVNQQDLKGELLSYYLSGLAGEKENYSGETRSLLIHLRGKARPSRKWVDFQKKRFKKKKSGHYQISPSTLLQIRQRVQQNFQAKLLEAYGRLKFTGGSGGLNRFETLIELADGTIEWLEFKAIAPRPGMFPMVSAKIPPPRDRYRDNIELQQGKMANKLYQIVPIGKQKYLSRYYWEGNEGYNLKPNTKESPTQFLERLKKICQDQAFILGKLHFKSLSKNSRKAFLANLKKSKNQKLIESYSKKMASLIKRSFEKSR